MAITKITLQCPICNKVFERRLAEVKRNEKKGARVHYCSLRCYGKDALNNIPESKRNHPENVTSNHGNRLDKYSKFRVLYRSAWYRHKHNGIACNLELGDLEKQWEVQEGI